MELISNVLTDIQSKYDIHPDINNPINNQDVQLIHDVLQELKCSFSTTTKQYIDSRYLDHKANVSEILEAPINETNHDEIDNDDSNESFIFSTGFVILSLFFCVLYSDKKRIFLQNAK